MISLNVSGCTALQRLICSDNQLASLDVSNCTALIVLDCGYNQLTSLNVSSCTQLKYLICWGNKITSVIPEWFSQLESFGYDQRFSYWTEIEYVGNGEYVEVTKHLDKGYGWWYPGEPGKGKHSPD